MEHGCHSVSGCWPGADYELGTAKKEASGIMELRQEPQQIGTLGDAGSGGFLNCSR